MGRDSEEEPETSTDDEADSIRELENELYSVVYYTGLNENIADDVQDKYNIQKNNNELIISVKPLVETNEMTQQFTLCDRHIDSPNEHETDHEIEHETEIIIENRIPNNDESRNKLLKRKRQDEVSDSEDDCLIIEPENNASCEASNKSNINHGLKKRKKKSEKAKKSSQISIVTLSDDSSDDSVIINIEQPKECVIVSDSESEALQNDKSSDFKLTKDNWKEISSPESWTPKMKKYYNAPSERLRTFDDVKMRKNMRERESDWFIIDLDRYPYNVFRPRCPRCKNRGHTSRECPMLRRNCHMCGLPGHSGSKCPGRMCLNCGGVSTDFVSLCDKCTFYKRYKCGTCHKKGHHEAVCPDSWRRFHNTTDGPVQQTSTNLKEKKHCCNCADVGHLYEHCPEPYWSEYPKSYSFVTNYGVNQNFEGETSVKNSTRLYLKKDEKLMSKEFYELIRKYQTVGVEIISHTNQPLPYLDVKGTGGKIWQLQNDVYNFLEQTVKKTRPPKKKRKKIFWRKKSNTS